MLRLLSRHWVQANASQLHCCLIDLAYHVKKLVWQTSSCLQGLIVARLTSVYTQSRIMQSAAEFQS